ncbi:MAG: universal stress protein [Alphaproteobacteria bacterium]|nr:universal stress protein [Alphaproteobacteria bacterium]
MTTADILVHQSRSPRSTIVADVALAIAAKHDAHVTALYVFDHFRMPGYISGRIPESVIKGQQAEAEAMAAKAAAAFHARAARAGVKHEWRTVEGPALDVVSWQGRYTDLIVVGQTAPDDEPECDDYNLAEEMLLVAGRPILVVPYISKYDSVGDRVMIAWNGSREASRAVHDAMPLLERAKSVNILSVDPENPNRLPGADIATHLARHGVKVEARRTVGGDLDIGDVLLSTAADLGADLVVMGGYGHSRAREAIFGGATRHMLRHMTCPVVLSH